MVIAYCLTSIPQDFDVKILKSFKERLETFLPWVGLFFLLVFLLSPKILTTMVVLENIISEDIRYKLLLPLILTGLAICTVFLFNRKLSTYLPSRLESRVLALGIVTISGYFMLKGWIEIEISSSSKEGELIWRPVMYLFGISFVSFSASEFLRNLLSTSDEIDEFETNILDWKNKSEIRQLLAIEQHVSEDLVVRYRIFMRQSNQSNKTISVSKIIQR